MGDPSGRVTARTSHADHIISTNVDSLKTAVQNFFDSARTYAALHSYDFPPTNSDVEIVDNMDWTQSLSLLDFLRHTGSQVRMARMVNRDRYSYLA